MIYLFVLGGSFDFWLGWGDWLAICWGNGCPFGLRGVFVVWVPDCWFGFFPPRVFGVGIFC